SSPPRAATRRSVSVWSPARASRFAMTVATLPTPEPVRTDFAPTGGDRRFVAALPGIPLEGAESGGVHHRGLPVLGLRCGEVDEADAVVEDEGGVANPRGCGFVEFLVDPLHELFVARRLIRLDLVAHHGLSFHV